MNIYQDFVKETSKLDSLRMKYDANLARHWKYLNQELKLSSLPKSLDKDFYAWKINFDKKGTNYTDDMKSFVR